MRELVEWVTAHGGFLHESVELAVEPGIGTLLKARQSIESDTPVVSCPHFLTISYLNAVSLTYSHGPAFPRSFLQALTPHTVTVFFLCQQWLLGEGSFWSSYIKSLPQPGDGAKLGTPLYFNEEDRLWLKGTNMEKGYLDRKKAWKDLRDKGISILKNEGWKTEEYTWSLALWAGTILSSRSFTSSLLTTSSVMYSSLESDAQKILDKNDTFPVLYPLVDTANHRSDAKMTWRSGLEKLGLVTVDSLAPGDIVWNNYGPKSNEELLLGYGFCIPGNPFDQFGLKIRNPENATLPSSGFLPDTTFYIRTPDGLSGLPPPFSEFFPRPLLKVLTNLVANDREKGSQPVDIDFDTYDRNRFSVMAQLLHILRRKRQVITQTDIAMTPISKNQRHAKIYRDGQVSIISAAIRALEVRLVDAAQSPEVRELITLEFAVKALSKLNQKQYKAFKKGLKAALGSSEISELRSAGWEQHVWTLWVCTLKLLIHQNEPLGSSKVAKDLMDWILNMEEIYPYVRPSATASPKNNDDFGDVAEVLNLIRVAAEKTLSFSNAEASFDGPLVRWGNNVAKEEGFAVFLNEEGPEQHVLYIGA